MTDSAIQVFLLESKKVRFVDGKAVACDVASVLGIKNSGTAVARVSPEYKSLVKVVTPGGMQSMVVLEEAGVLQLVSSSRSPKALEIAKKLGFTTFRSSPEQESVLVLESAFADLSPIRQFAVHGYRIDLYLAKVNLAIECDERGHLHGYPNDSVREQTIKSALGCSFVRFNPNEAGFNIGDVIFAIRKLV
ncbi:MAG: BRO family protein [Flavobacterium sp.]|jgi:very-short-patch-repair endonuclease